MKKSAYVGVVSSIVEASTIDLKELAGFFKLLGHAFGKAQQPSDHFRGVDDNKARILWFLRKNERQVLKFALKALQVPRTDKLLPGTNSKKKKAYLTSWLFP